MKRRRSTAPGPCEAMEQRVMFAVTPAAAPSVPFHLPAHTWRALDVSANDYLTKAERLARALGAHQDDAGHVVDPYTGENEKTSTPYFAYVVGVLANAGKATDLVPAGIRAMEAATAEMAATVDGAEDDDGNTFLQPLSDALAMYEARVSPETLDSWRAQLQRPIMELIDDNPNNHRAYAMKGQWARALAGLVTREEAVAFVEENWVASQRGRITEDNLSLYHDRSSSPDSMSTESVGRVQLLWLLANGYDGPSRAEMESLLSAGTKNLLALQDPTGQAPTGGRASGAVWNDTNVAMCFELMASVSVAAGDTATAGAYRRAADLALRSTERWEQPDGTQTVLKNRYDPSLRVGFARYNSWSNSNASQAYRFAAIYEIRRATTGRLAEAPTPAEIGGYTVRTDDAFATAFASAGGLQVEASLRGATEQTHDLYWSTLGITRFSRSDWDSRLGPSDGQRDPNTGRAVSFAPEFQKSGGGWDRISELPETYTGKFSTQFVSPVLVRAAIDYTPEQAGDGPTFHQELLITPDGVLSTLTSSAAAGKFGLTLPVLVGDGEDVLSTNYSSHIARTRYPGSTDEQNFISLDATPTFTTTDAPVQGAFGDIRPVRLVGTGSSNVTFVYPRTAEQPSAELVRASFAMTPDGYASKLGKVTGNTYVGRTSAGGEGTGLDFDGDGANDLTFSEACVFVMQRVANGRITNVETDRPVTMTMNGRDFTLEAYTPLTVNLVAPPVSPGEPIVNDNEPPSIEASASEYAAVGMPASVFAEVSDDGMPGDATTILWEKISGPGSVSFADAVAAETTATFDQPGDYLLRATASDGELTTSDTVTITAVDPSTIPVAADDAVVRPLGGGVDVNVLANDDTAAGAALSVATQPAGGTAAVNDHGTPDPADDTITYTPAAESYADDSFTYRVGTGGSGMGTTATVRVTVGAGAALVPDPADATKTALLVIGSDESEVFKFAKKRDGLYVLRNKQAMNEAALGLPTGSVIVLARGGDDTVAPGAVKGLPVVLHGGDGNDRLTGSKFNDTLIGGNGNDVINGAAGLDLLIGGRGADGLTGAGGDDVIITGGTTYDDPTPGNAAALRDVLAAWVVAAPYGERVAAITAPDGVGSGGAGFGAALLVSDADADSANGSGGNDFFLADPTADRVKKTSAETNGSAPAAPPAA